MALDTDLYDGSGRPVVRMDPTDLAAMGGGGGGGTSDAAVIGPVNETAPTTDTASSALNGRLQRIAQRLTSLISLLPANLGAKPAASSLAVTLATDDVLLTRQGALTETAPATDTASSGLNGRLQRVAQRITSLIASLPASLGAKTAANSLATTLATDDLLVTAVGPASAAAATSDTGTFSLIALVKRLLVQSNSASARVAEVVTKSDTVNFTNGTCKGIYVGTTGTVIAVINGSAITFTAVPAGMILPVKATRVNASSTANNMVALFD
jgi:hypothetical protein